MGSELFWRGNVARSSYNTSCDNQSEEPSTYATWKTYHFADETYHFLKITEALNHRANEKNKSFRITPSAPSKMKVVFSNFANLVAHLVALLKNTTIQYATKFAKFENTTFIFEGAEGVIRKLLFFSLALWFNASVILRKW